MVTAESRQPALGDAMAQCAELKMYLECYAQPSPLCIPDMGWALHSEAIGAFPLMLVFTSEMASRMSLTRIACTFKR